MNSEKLAEKLLMGKLGSKVRKPVLNVITEPVTLDDIMDRLGVSEEKIRNSQFTENWTDYSFELLRRNLRSFLMIMASDGAIGWDVVGIKSPSYNTKDKYGRITGTGNYTTYNILPDTKYFPKK
ncbi:MAG: hypothetical protein PHW96_02145 [Candidatus Nanoarchaeia archaeon]|nr:hypothetical protein [Candidatus Nanoarchaeia archaeon]